MLMSAIIEIAILSGSLVITAWGGPHILSRSLVITAWGALRYCAKRVPRHHDTSLSDTKRVPFHHGMGSPQIPYGIEGFYVDVEGRSKPSE